MTLQMVAKSEPEGNLLTELRTSLEAANVTWALAQADLSLRGRPIPDKITDLHHHERRRYEQIALTALLGCNLDAVRYAEMSAGNAAWEVFEDWTAEQHPGWLEAQDVDPVQDTVCLMARKAIERFGQVMSGVYPGLMRYLARVERNREADDV